MDNIKINPDSITLNFNGLINQEGLINFLSIIEGQMLKCPDTKKRIFYIMVEMLQNIINHADNYTSQPDGMPGVFNLKEGLKKFYLITGNYILNKKIKNLKSKIEHINSLNNNELNELYNTNLLDFDTKVSKKKGLGIIDLRLKSDSRLGYSFKQVDNDYSLFTLQTKIIKN